MIRGTGSRLENETVIVFNDAEPDAIVDTASPPVYRKMVKRGYRPSRETANRATFLVPKRAVRLPARPRQPSSENPSFGGGLGRESAHPRESPQVGKLPDATEGGRKRSA